MFGSMDPMHGHHHEQLPAAAQQEQRPGWWREEAEALGLSLTSPGRSGGREAGHRGPAAVHTTSSFSPTSLGFGESEREVLLAIPNIM